MIFRTAHSFCLCLGCLCVTASGIHAQNLFTNGDFEIGTEGWAAFVPDEAKPNDCKVEVSGENPHEGQSLRLSCSGASRFAATTVIKGTDWVPGDRYRVSLWARAGEDFLPAQGTRGFMIRIGFFSDPVAWTPASGGSFHLMTGNHTSVGGTPTADEELPKKWTKMEGVFEIPADTAMVNAALFIWKGTGSVYVDDLVLEKVDATTPLSN
jgi:hypothetical protein